MRFFFYHFRYDERADVNMWLTIILQIYFCSIFFDEVASDELCTGGTNVTSRNVRGGTLLHEVRI